jgi:hypothetical protein
VLTTKIPGFLSGAKARGLCRKKLGNCGKRVNSANFKTTGLKTQQDLAADGGPEENGRGGEI